VGRIPSQKLGDVQQRIRNTITDCKRS